MNTRTTTLERSAAPKDSSAPTSVVETETSRPPVIRGVVEVVDKSLLPPTERLAIAWGTRCTDRLMADILGVRIGGVVYLPRNDINLTIGMFVQIDQGQRGGLRTDGLTQCTARFRRIS